MRERLMTSRCAVALVCAWLPAFSLFAQDIKRDNPSGLFSSPRFTNVVDVPAGTDLIFVSGLTAEGKDGSVPHGAQAQADAVFAHLRAALESRGLKPSDVIQIRAFMVDLPHTIQAYRKAAAGFFAGSPPPASAAVGVSALVSPELLMEVELVAARPAPASKKMAKENP